MVTIVHNCFWREEEIVAYVFGELAEQRKEQFVKHLAQCAHCQETYAEWNEIYTQQCKQPGPPKKLRRRLKKALVPSSGRRVSKHVFAAVTMGLIVCLSSFIYGVHWQSQTIKSNPEVALYSPSLHFGGGADQHLRRQKDKTTFSGMPIAARHNLPFISGRSEPGVISFTAINAKVKNAVSTTASDRMRLVPIHDGNVSGYIWVNRKTNEMILFLAGLTTVAEKQFQAWLITPSTRKDAGILTAHHGMAHLYYRGEHVEEAIHLMITSYREGHHEMQGSKAPLWISIQ